MEKILNYIDGEWIESTAVNFIEVINPATGEHLGQTPLSLRSDVDACIQAAHAAFPGWRRTPAVERVQYLFKLKVLMEDNLDDLARTITQECGKTYEEAVAEMRRAIENVEIACGIPILAQGTIAEDIAPGIDEIMIRQPVGVAAAICPFNYLQSFLNLFLGDA